MRKYNINYSNVSKWKEDMCLKEYTFSVCRKKVYIAKKSVKVVYSYINIYVNVYHFYRLFYWKGDLYERVCSKKQSLELEKKCRK